MKIEINDLNDLEKYSQALLNHEEAKLYNRQRFWHPAAVITGIVLTSVGFTIGLLKLLGLI